ncbi:G8 domain-containing protein [uncultured Microscilla sp.]|uniref:G8 domain-containing protein n=1 Tax=uncultured Microscilla sp. TaxID=432653 RepID=UPI0026397C9F|nr:G8 domain-containing protein [uncultured Microscilla sp.]
MSLVFGLLMLCSHFVNGQISSVANPAAPLIAGGFEQINITDSRGFMYINGAHSGMTFANGAGVSGNNTGFTKNNPNAPQGSQVLFLQNSGSVQGAMNVTARGYYRLIYKSAVRAGNTKAIRVEISGKKISEATIPSSNYTQMHSLPVYLNPGWHYFKFTGVNIISGDHTAFVDDIKLQRVYDWRDANAWSPRRVPNANDAVTISAGTAVVPVGDFQVKSITVNGHLQASVSSHANITTNSIMVMGGNARMEFGQERVPHPHKTTITLNAPYSARNAHPHMGNNFIGVMGGGILHLHGISKKSWTKVQDDLGNAHIRLAEAVNWQAGDEVVITSKTNNWNQAEKRTIAAVGDGGKLLRFTQNLTYNHQGAIRNYSRSSHAVRNWSADLRPEVGLLSHSIKIQGHPQGNAQGYGGHVMIMSNSKAYVENIELYNMGQKAILGRYPYHWHMLGNVGAGQYLKSSSVHQSYNRAITIHGTESTLVENNFCYDHIGHGVFLENGSERFNVIRKNVVLLTKRPAPEQQLTPSDNQFNVIQNRTPASFWITNPQNTFEQNIAAGTEGTGYWFAFPQKPMGESATDPRFSALEPYKAPLIKFDRNTAHSCMNGLDIFDQLNSDHSIQGNGGWDHTPRHWLTNCLWYANDLGIYTGTGRQRSTYKKSNNLIFENNMFVANKTATMFASYSIASNSLIVAQAGLNLLPANTERFAYRVYDGAGQLHNCHLVGWNSALANLLDNIGGGNKHPNHYFAGNTLNHGGTPRLVLPNYDLKPRPAPSASDDRQPRRWSMVIRDLSGTISGVANTSIVSNHPFMLVGDEVQPSNWSKAYRSNHHFAFCALSYNNHSNSNPNVTVTRTKSGTPDASVHYIPPGSYKEHHQLPLIVNEGFLYTYRYESAPIKKQIILKMADAFENDHYMVRFKDFGKAGGLGLTTTQLNGGNVPKYNTYAALQSATSTGYYKNGTDLYLKVVAKARLIGTEADEQVTIRWTTNPALSKIDTDGDEMSDLDELNAGRHPFDASDLGAYFNTPGNFEGWTSSSNISNFRVEGGFMKGVSSGNGDAQIRNNPYNFNADRVKTIQIHMRASTNTLVQLFFTTNTDGSYGGSKVVSVNYTGNGAYQTLTFPVGNNAAWNGKITRLRLDPVGGLNISFDIFWIRAQCVGCSAGGASYRSTTKASKNQQTLVEAKTSRSSQVIIYPNPVNDQLNLKGVEKGTQIQILSSKGQLLKTLRYQGPINFAPFSKGIYFLKIENDIYKLIK